MRTFARWLANKWERSEQKELENAYRVTFDNVYGRIVLHHWLNNIYCQYSQSTDPIELATHNGRRSVIHEILEALDMAEHPDKYQAEVDGG